MGGLSAQELIVLVLLFLAIFFGVAILIFMAVVIRRRQGGVVPGGAARCSFCGKSQSQVKRLIAGPAVYICNECVAVCNKIISDDNIADSKVTFPS